MGALVLALSLTGLGEGAGLLFLVKLVRLIWSLDNALVDCSSILSRLGIWGLRIEIGIGGIGGAAAGVVRLGRVVSVGAVKTGSVLAGAATVSTGADILGDLEVEPVTTDWG